MITEQDELVLAKARLMREHAYTPLSNFKVGAAVMAEDGTIYGGCNIENAAMGLAMCAERTAIFSAVAGGARQLFTLAVIADGDRPVAPCGACRQVMAEFGIKKVILANMDGKVEEHTVEELLPGAFSAMDM